MMMSHTPFKSQKLIKKMWEKMCVCVCVSECVGEGARGRGRGREDETGRQEKAK